MAQHAPARSVRRLGPAVRLEDGGGSGTAGCRGSMDSPGLSWHHLSPADGGQHTGSSCLDVWGDGAGGTAAPWSRVYRVGRGSLTLQKSTLSEGLERGLVSGRAPDRPLGWGGAFISKCPLCCVTSWGTFTHLCS